MNIAEIMSVVDHMNNKLPDDCHQAFWWQHNSYADVILFENIVLWDSENDDRMEIVDYLDDEQGRRETLLEAVDRAFADYVTTISQALEKGHQVELAKEMLDDAGYFVDNLWSIDDVISKEGGDKLDEFDQRAILEEAVTNEFIISQINDEIQNLVDNEQ